ncbi:MAG: hypothetical protein ACYSR6_01015 [Planctomycetota bacterium]|jgi:hypothetical protein
MKPHIVLLLIGMQIAIASPAYSVHGREYVERERRIVKLTKQMVQRNSDAQAYRELLLELDSIGLEETPGDFWHMAREMKSAMTVAIQERHKRLRRQGIVVQSASAADNAPYDLDDGAENENPLVRRVGRMEMIMLETDGLCDPQMMNDSTVFARYRLLVGEFHSLMQADVDELQAEIDTLKEQQRATKN